MDVVSVVRSKAKAVAGFVMGLAGPLVAFYQVNQSVSLRELLMALVAGVVTGGAVHQVTNQPVKK